MTNVEVLREILTFYRFDIPLSDRNRLHSIKSKKKVLVAILKRYGKYTVVVMLCINFVFVLKKTGIYITLAKSFSILIISIVLFLSTVLLAYIFLHIPDENDIGIFQKPVIDAKSEAQPLVKGKPVFSVIQYRFQIADFSSMPAEKSVAERFVRVMKREISKNGGKDVVAFLVDTKGYQAPNIITGSVLKTNEGYMVTVHIVDSGSSQVKSVFREQAVSMDDLDGLAKKIALEVTSLR
jgi:hypothetical protein